MTENGKEILNKIKDNTKLKEKLKQCKSKDEVIKVLNANNLKCVDEDFKDLNSHSKLSIDELKKVSGGGRTSCVCVIGGDGCGNHNCSCLVYGDGYGVCYCICVIGGGGEYN